MPSFDTSGNVVLLENTRSDIKMIGITQDLLEPFVTPLARDCKWNVDIDSLAKESGLHLLQKEKRSWGTLELGVYEPTKSTKY